jgi:cyclophilin family peptidyl-prolyl cis-trans isomerase
MKISLRSLAVFALVLIVVAAYIIISRSHNLPDGKVTQTSAINIPDDNSGSVPVIPGHPRVEITTSKGSFIVELRPDVAPRSVLNFLGKWSNGYCNSKIFHRVEDWVVQGCDPKGNGTGGSDTLPTENSLVSFVRGSVGVARKLEPANLSNDSQFFIVKKDTPSLDGSYTYLGRVVSGMDVIDSISRGDTIESTVILSK